MDFKKILLPLDGFELAERSLSAALMIAEVVCPIKFCTTRPALLPLFVSAEQPRHKTAAQKARPSNPTPPR